MLSKFFTNSFVVKEIDNDAMPPLFCGTIINVLVLLYFVNKKINIKEKIMSFLIIIMFLLSFYFTNINLLWTLGNIPAFYLYRYAFCFIFMYVIIAHKSFENIKYGLNFWKIIFCIVFYEIIGFLVLNYNLGVANKTWVKIDMIFALIFGIFIWLCTLNIENAKIKLNILLKRYSLSIISVIIFIITISELIINATFSMKILREETSKMGIEDYIKLINLYDYKYSKLQEKDNELYRIEDKYRMNTNDAIVFGFNGINYSGSTFSRKLYLFLRRFGYSKQHVMIISDIGNTKTADMLLGIKYIMNTENKIGVKNYKEQNLADNFIIYENPYALNLGFTVSENVIEDVKIDETNAFVNQNNFLKNITNLEEDIFTSQKGKINKITNNLIADDKKYTVINEDEERSLIYEFEIEKEEEAYLYIWRR